MFRCPNCQQPGLRAFELARSTSWSPAHCAVCGKPAHAHGAFSLATELVGHLLFYASIATAFYFWSWWPFAVFVFVAGGLQWLPLVVPAVPTSPERIHTARWIYRGILLLFVAGLGYAALTHA